LLDAVHLEAMGIPTVTFVTAPFESAARTHARIHGMDDLPLILVPADYLENSDEVIEARLQPILDAVLEALVSRR
jgi:hypothetical protein